MAGCAWLVGFGAYHHSCGIASRRRSSPLSPSRPRRILCAKSGSSNPGSVAQQFHPKVADEMLFGKK